MGTVESGSLSCFFWHIAKSNQTYGSGDINYWENCRGGVAGVGAGGGGGVQYVTMFGYPVSELLKLITL